MRKNDPHAQQRLDSVSLQQVSLNRVAETVKMMHGLQAVYADEQPRKEVLDLIAKDVLQGARHNSGRPGTALWSIIGTIPSPFSTTPRIR